MKVSRRSAAQKPYCVPKSRRRASLSADPNLESSRKNESTDVKQRRRSLQTDSESSKVATKAKTNTNPASKNATREDKSKPKTKSSAESCKEDIIKKRAGKLRNLNFGSRTSVDMCDVSDDAKMATEEVTSMNEESSNNGKRMVRFNVTNEVFEYEPNRALLSKTKSTKQVSVPNK